MPDGNNFIVRRCHVNWRDFAFFMKTDWGDLIKDRLQLNWTDTNLNHESNFHYFYHGIGFVAEE